MDGEGESGKMFRKWEKAVKMSGGWTDEDDTADV